MSPYIKILRPFNLFIILFTQAVVMWRFSLNYDETYLLRCALIIIATVLTSAAGYIVNDIYDIKADQINKPERQWIPVFISVRSAWIFYGTLNLFALLASYYYGLNSEDNIFTITVIAIQFLLWVYAVWLKKVPLVGNLLVAACASSVVVVCILVIKIQHQTALFMLVSFIAFSFFVNLIRELVKDLEHLEGDAAAGYNTYAIFAGVKGSKAMIYATLTTQILLCGIFVFISWGIGFKIMSIVMCLIILGFFYFIERLTKANEKVKYAYCSLILKILMLLGLICLAIS
ncbi:MAG: geranylgeranylglycerol-phosphate geranylgeranyltransferase [Bacteroidia bacterium]|nr:geranylgeranylglycerol-phosphate geranylgeranyltransferase [Bacteroidia bacterium]